MGSLGNGARHRDAGRSALLDSIPSWVRTGREPSHTCCTTRPRKTDKQKDWIHPLNLQHCASNDVPPYLEVCGFLLSLHAFADDHLCSQVAFEITCCQYKSGSCHLIFLDCFLIFCPIVSSILYFSFSLFQNLTVTRFYIAQLFQKIKT